jgi:PKD repeat protein
MRKRIIQWSFAMLVIAIIGVSCKDDKSAPVVPHGANFETVIEPTGEGKKITFKNTSANAQAAFWTFGDDSTSTEMSPTHVYADKGIYKVNLVSIGIPGSDPLESIKTIQLTVTLPPIATCDVKAATDNFIKGGDFQNAADSSWHISNLTAAGLPIIPDYAFGATVNGPCETSGGSLRINNVVPAKDNGMLIWQSLGVLPVGNYRFSGDVNILTGESQDAASTTAGKNYFVEAFLDSIKPKTHNSLSARAADKKPNLLAGFNAWWGGATNDIPAGKGSFPGIGYPFEDATTLKANARGDFKVTRSQEYFFAVQVGTYGGSYGAGGINIDNFAIVKRTE